MKQQTNGPPSIEGYTPAIHSITQSDLFPETVIPPKLDSIDKLLSDLEIPDPIKWSEDEKLTLCLNLASEMWNSVLQILEERLDKQKHHHLKLMELPKEFRIDYISTLGWLLSFHSGSIPIRIVMQFENADIQDSNNDFTIENTRRIIKSHPIISEDILDLISFLNCEDFQFQIEALTDHDGGIYHA